MYIPVGFPCWNCFFIVFKSSCDHSMGKCWGSNFITPEPPPGGTLFKRVPQIQKMCICISVGNEPILMILVLLTIWGYLVMLILDSALQNQLVNLMQTCTSGIMKFPGIGKLSSYVCACVHVKHDKQKPIILFKHEYKLPIQYVLLYSLIYPYTYILPHNLYMIIADILKIVYFSKMILWIWKAWHKFTKYQ